jgi:predicted XRE-type DNA-binding protein
MKYRCKVIFMRDDEFDDGEPDFLDEVIAESTAQNPDFPRLMEEARRKREFMHALKAERKRRKVSQKKVAKAMGTTQSAVSELESNTAGDARLSTFEKYAEAIGYAVEFHLVPVEQAAGRPAVVVEERLSA